MKRNFFYTIDKVIYKDIENARYIAIIGWCYSKDDLPLTYSAKINNKEAAVDIIKSHRQDVFKEQHVELKSDLV